MLNIKGVKDGLSLGFGRLNPVEDARDEGLRVLFSIVPALYSDPIIKGSHFLPLGEGRRVGGGIAVGI